ncbi:nucleotide exchange factor GrpE [Pedobacter sp. BS3]|uniref:nucleotide exchange factor GrpE n=1 Tax=Pedobacter sp. BS3 TaxID=2567937 RepID=UPI0011ECEC9E|nr:nucleotide exchange factor GrpE [Pedobacter sp. BS3]TZF83851.1 nucleotide exchange factor GrpE [Pedobacter sp. BS3]
MQKTNQREQQPVSKDKNSAEEIEQVNEATQDHKDDDGADEGAELSELDKAKAEAADANDKYLRLYAEFDNFKRRTTKERIDLLQSAGKDILLSLLPVLDDFERAIKSMENATDIESVKEGVMLIYHKLKTTLQQKGVKEMKSVGEPFNADIHEAISNIPAPSDDLKGKVVDELEKGYYLNDKVLRFAKVIVGA